MSRFQGRQCGSVSAWVNAESVKVQAGEVLLDGDLVIPDEARGLILFAHGGGSSRLSPRNQAVARALNDGGLASLLMDLLTEEEQEIDERTRGLRFDIPRLGERMIGAVDWARNYAATRAMSIGLFGASTGAAGALLAAADRPLAIGAVVSRGGRPDLAAEALPRVQAPTTIVGGGEQEYGDQDGQGPSARLQHPQAIAWHEGRLYVADTYNHKIKMIDLASGVCRSLLGTGQPGSDDGAEPSFYESAGLAVAEDRLFIADTNNHLIRVADLNDLNVLTLPVPELEATTTREEEEEVEERVRELPPQTVQPGPVTLSIVLDLPAALAVKVDSPGSLHLNSSDGSILSSGLADRTIARPQFPLLTVLEVQAGRSELLIDLALYYCRTDKRRLSYFKRNRIKLPIHGDPTSAHTQLRVRHRPPYLT